jgi:hypothetical protein
LPFVNIERDPNLLTEDMILERIVQLREQLPPGMGMSPGNMAALAWEYGDDENARVAYGVEADIERLRSDSRPGEISDYWY